MTITSIGYAGTIEAAQWSNLVPFAAGSEYGVLDPAHWRPTIGPGTRQVLLSAGSGWGKGVLDESSAQESVTLGSVPTGSRWDLIVARRTWATKVTEFVVVPGGSAKVIPARAVNPGTVDEQPVALARVQAGQSAVQEIVDLRVFPRAGGAAAVDSLVRTYLTGVGTQLLIGDTLWMRSLDGSGSAVWVQDRVGDTGDVTDGMTINTGPYFTLVRYRLRRMSGRVTGQVVVRCTHNIGISPDGSFGLVNVIRLPSGWRPTTDGLAEIRGMSSDVPFFGTIDTTGLVNAQRGIPGNAMVSGGQYGVYVDFPV